MTDEKDPHMTMALIDDRTGEEIPTTAEEKRAAFESLREAMRHGSVELSDQARESMKAKGLTLEQIESWLYPEKN